MRNTFFAVAALVSLIPNVGFAVDPIEIPSPVDSIFIPSGYDDNDNIEIILQGHFRNTCQRTGRSGFSIDEESRTIKIWATSYQYDSAPCATLVTPFIQVVKVGFLPFGGYRVVYGPNTSVARDIAVARRVSESPDEYTYAPVTEVAIRTNQELKPQFIEMEGVYPLMLHGCSKITRIIVNRDDRDIIVVQPVMEIFDGADCDDHELEFKKVVELETPFRGKGLLHVRVLNGNSLNKYIEIN